MQQIEGWPIREKLSLYGSLTWFLVRNGLLLETGALCVLVGLRLLEAGWWLAVLPCLLVLAGVVRLIGVHAARYEAWLFWRIRQRSKMTHHPSPVTHHPSPGTYHLSRIWHHLVSLAYYLVYQMLSDAHRSSNTIEEEEKTHANQ